MAQKVTQDQKETNAALMNRKEKMFPRKDTLHFIKQFACSYHAEKKLPAILPGIVLN